MRLSSCNTDKFQFVWQSWKRGIRLWRRFFAPPLVSKLPDGLRSNANPILRLIESQRGVRILSYQCQRNKKQPSFSARLSFYLAQEEGFALEFYKIFRIGIKDIICKILRSTPKTIINRFLTAGFESFNSKKEI